MWLPADARIELDAITMKAGPSVFQDGSAAVVFTMDGPDRQKFTTALIEHFELAGWRQRAHQWLNPHLATSFSAGWRGMNGAPKQAENVACGSLTPTSVPASFAV